MRISIVTVVYNRVHVIADAIASVLSQAHQDVEYIVVDGGSTDGTVNVIREWENRFGGRMKWISEKDHGIYDAMNKGIRMATGEVIAILNSDDFYHRTDTLQRVADEFIADPDLQVVYGDNLWVNSSDLKKVIRYSNGDNYNSFTARCGVVPPHATFFVRKANFEKYGYYDTSYRICADYERELYFLEKLKLKSKYLGFPFMTMRVGGVSSSGLKGYLTSVRECHRACKSLGLFTCWPMQVLKLVIKLPQKFMLRNKHLFHAFFVSVEVAILSTAALYPWFVSKAVRYETFGGREAEVAFCLADGQAEVIRNIIRSDLCYVTQSEQELSGKRCRHLPDRQLEAGKRYTYTIPPESVGFRLDFHLKGDSERVVYPKLSELTLNGRSIEEQMVTHPIYPTDPFPCWFYFPKPPLNGYLQNLIWIVGVLFVTVFLAFCICIRVHLERTIKDADAV